MAARLDPTHRFHRVGGYLFCAKCGAYTSGPLRLLGVRCAGHPTSQRRTILDRLMGGRHPKEGSFIGEPSPVLLAELQEAMDAERLLRPG